MAEESAREGITNALIGTSWKCTETELRNGTTFTHEYIFTFVDENTVERVYVGSDEVHTWQWELNIYDINAPQSIFVDFIFGDESYAHQPEKITFTKSGENYTVKFVGSSKTNGEGVEWTKIE